MTDADRASILVATRRIRRAAGVLADHAVWGQRLTASDAERMAAELRADAVLLDTLAVEQSP